MTGELCVVGVFGLTNNGQQFAAHIASNKTRVCIADEDSSFATQVVNEFRRQTEKRERENGQMRNVSEYYESDLEDTDGERSATLVKESNCMIGSSSLEEFTSRLVTPRQIIIFGTNAMDKKFQEVWNELFGFLEKGDIILRWGREEDGNSPTFQFFSESLVANLSHQQAQQKEVHLLEMVRLERDRVSSLSAKTMDAFLVGGPRVAYDKLEPLVSSYATIGHSGNSAGCAHYAQMIQRAIEFGVTQPLAEGADILKKVTGYTNQDVGRIMNQWNDGGRLASYLLEISSKICYKRDNITNTGHVIDHIIDCVDLKSSDTWAILEATKLGVPVPTLNAALEARFFSTMKNERVEASSILKAPSETPVVSKDQIIDDLQNAIYCTSLCAYAEGFSIFLAASDAEGWEVNIAECARLWNSPGTFLASELLEKISSSWHKNGEMTSLLMDASFASELNELQMPWRRMVTLCFACGIPCPTLCSSLTHYESFRSRKSPVGIIRAQRDFFGAYGYDRFDTEGKFSCCWTKEHTIERKRREAANK